MSLKPGRKWRRKFARKFRARWLRALQRIAVQRQRGRKAKRLPFPVTGAAMRRSRGPLYLPRAQR